MLAAPHPTGNFKRHFPVQTLCIQHGTRSARKRLGCAVPLEVDNGAREVSDDRAPGGEGGQEANHQCRSIDDSATAVYKVSTGNRGTTPGRTPGMTQK